MITEAQRAARAEFRRTSRFSPPCYRPGGMTSSGFTADGLSRFEDARAPLEADGLAAYLRAWCAVVPDGKPVLGREIAHRLNRPVRDVLAVLHGMRAAGRVVLIDDGWWLLP